MSSSGWTRPSSSVESDLGASVEEAVPDDVVHVSISRAGIIPEAAFAGRVVERLPVVWGRTVWETATGMCVVERPNGLGCFEIAPSRDFVVIATGAPGREADPTAIERAATLRKALLQGRSVAPAVPALESARFVVLFPVPPDEILTVARPVGVRAAPFGRDLAEYPGGIRFDVAADAVESDLTAYAAQVGARIGS